MKQEFKNRVIFQLISLLPLTLISIYAIVNMVLVGFQEYQSRSYFFGIVLWCFIMGAVQVGYSIFTIIRNFKQKKPFYYLLTIQSSSCTLIAMILLMTEYFVFREWYAHIETSGAWNATVTYSLLSIILGLFISNLAFTGYILYKTRPIPDLEEDIL